MFLSWKKNVEKLLSILSIVINKRNLDLSLNFLFENVSGNRVVIFAEGNYKIQSMNVVLSILLPQTCLLFSGRLVTLETVQKHFEVEERGCVLMIVLPPVASSLLLKYILSNSAVIKRDIFMMTIRIKHLPKYFWIHPIYKDNNYNLGHWLQPIGGFFLMPLPKGSKSRLQFLLH